MQFQVGIGAKDPTILAKPRFALQTRVFNHNGEAHRRISPQKMMLIWYCFYQALLEKIHVTLYCIFFSFSESAPIVRLCVCF